MDNTATVKKLVPCVAMELMVIGIWMVVIYDDDGGSMKACLLMHRKVTRLAKLPRPPYTLATRFPVLM